MRSRRPGRSAKAGRGQFGRVWGRLRSRHSPLGALFLLGLEVGGIRLETLPVPVAISFNPMPSYALVPLPAELRERIAPEHEPGG